MKLAFSAIAEAYDRATLHPGPLLLGNLAATLCSLPLLLPGVLLGRAVSSWGVLILTCAFLVVVLPSPAAAGLQYVSHKLALGIPFVTSGEIRQGYRHYAGVAMRTWLLGISGSIIIFANIAFYLTLHGPVATILRYAWLYVLVFWVITHVYVYPLITEQHVKRGLLVYRNAIVMTVTRPLYTLVVGVAWILILAVSSVTGLLGIFGLAFGASIQNSALVHILPTYDVACAEVPTHTDASAL